MIFRDETVADIPAIHALTKAAFAGAAHASGTEQAITDTLRDTGALRLSLVAESDGVVVGHAAFSPVVIGPIMIGGRILAGSVLAPSRSCRIGRGRASARRWWRRASPASRGGQGLRRAGRSGLL